MKTLVKFEWDCGRQGNLEGLFIAEKNKVTKLIGKEIYFGEVLGKHSEIYGPLEEKDITFIDVPSDALEAIEKACGKNISGYNPLDYYEEKDESL